MIESSVHKPAHKVSKISLFSFTVLTQLINCCVSYISTPVHTKLEDVMFFIAMVTTPDIKELKLVVCDALPERTLHIV